MAAETVPVDLTIDEDKTTARDGSRIAREPLGSLTARSMIYTAGSAESGKTFLNYSRKGE